MFIVDPLSRTPVYMQIIEQAEKYILSDILKPGDQMPSVRSLSASLKVNPNTIQKAFLELDRLGLTRAVPGIGSYITDDAKEKVTALKSKQLSDLDAIILDLKLAGISKETIIEHVERGYAHD